MLKWLRRSEPKEVPAATLGPLQIAKPWARSSTQQPDLVGGFMTVINDGETDRLLSATCAGANSVEIYAIRVKGPHLEMRKIDDGLVMPPANQQVLKPRGYHLQIKGLASPPAPGGKLAITLVFEKAGSVTVDFAVEEPGAVGHATLSSS